MPTSSKLTPQAAAVCNKDATVFLLRSAGLFRDTSEAGNSYATGRVQEGRAVFPSLVFACLLVAHIFVCRENVTVVRRTDSERQRNRERERERQRQRERNRDRETQTDREAATDCLYWICELSFLQNQHKREVIKSIKGVNEDFYSSFKI